MNLQVIWAQVAQTVEQAFPIKENITWQHKLINSGHKPQHVIARKPLG